ncbi:isoprenoid synthase domain-containing protein [Gymnopilus junonius]|uniref:Isoprenoid synthase domain-containing protein n=1 Tax=Gymnopilus junonius TaxID=109634 RepID=A0A9P5NLN3_GYMJU|nr:isoprenoid synthase domain-containing protein [Gymnopilus junonius]
MVNVLGFLQSHLPTRNSLTWSISRIVKQNYSDALYKRIVSDFVKALDYSPPAWRGAEVDITSTVTYKYLLSEFSAFGSDKWIEAISLLAATYGELPYPNHPAEVRLRIARFTWCLIYIDDLGHRNPSVLEAFQQGVLENYEVGETPLQGFRDHLADIYNFWDTVPADCITVGGMEFIIGRLLEINPAIRDMKATTATYSWPNFLREKTGAPAPFAFMIFPKASNVKISTYIQAIEDMKIVINYSNDLLSFYKEELDGETDNYIHNRARATRKPIPETLRDVANEVVAAHYRVTQILQSTDGELAWKQFAVGNLDLYFSGKRYRLGELGF